MIKAKKRQQLAVGRRETCLTSSNQLVKGERFFQGLQSKIAAAGAEMSDWREQATEVAEELKVAQNDVDLQSTLWEAAQKKMNTRQTELMALQEQLMAVSAGLSQLSAKHIELADEVSLVKSKSAAGDPVSGNLMLVAVTRERSANLAKITRQCKKFLLLHLP